MIILLYQINQVRLSVCDFFEFERIRKKKLFRDSVRHTVSRYPNSAHKFDKVSGQYQGWKMQRYLPLMSFRLNRNCSEVFATRVQMRTNTANKRPTIFSTELFFHWQFQQTNFKLTELGNPVATHWFRPRRTVRLNSVLRQI